MKRELFATVVAALALCACDDDRPPQPDPTAPPQGEVRDVPCDGLAGETDCAQP